MKSILKCLRGALKHIYIYNVIYIDLGRPGDTFVVAGDRAI